MYHIIVNGFVCSSRFILQKLLKVMVLLSCICYTTATQKNKIFYGKILFKWVYKIQKQPFRGVFRKSCSENTEQIYTHVEVEFQKSHFAPFDKAAKESCF